VSELPIIGAWYLERGDPFHPFRVKVIAIKKGWVKYQSRGWWPFRVTFTSSISKFLQRYELQDDWNE
jgi:hypothetical protein